MNSTLWSTVTAIASSVREAEPGEIRSLLLAAELPCVGQDVSHLSTEEIAQVVAAQPVCASSSKLVAVYWPFEDLVAEMCREDLIRSFGDLWAPSSDDHYVTNGRHHLLIDHEETIFSR